MKIRAQDIRRVNIKTRRHGDKVVVAVYVMDKHGKKHRRSNVESLPQQTRAMMTMLDAADDMPRDTDTLVEMGRMYKWRFTTWDFYASLKPEHRSVWIISISAYTFRVRTSKKQCTGWVV